MPHRGHATRHWRASKSDGNHGVWAHVAGHVRQNLTLRCHWHGIQGSPQIDSGHLGRQNPSMKMIMRQCFISLETTMWWFLQNSSTCKTTVSIPVIGKTPEQNRCDNRSSIPMAGRTNDDGAMARHLFAPQQNVFDMCKTYQKDVVQKKNAIHKFIKTGVFCFISRAQKKIGKLANLATWKQRLEVGSPESKTSFHHGSYPSGKLWKITMFNGKITIP